MYVVWRSVTNSKHLNKQDNMMEEQEKKTIVYQTAVIQE